MQHLSKLPHVQTTIFTVMSNLAHKHGALNLSQGFPDFNSDKVLIDLVTKAMKEGYNQYAPMAGIIELREAIARKFELLYGTTYDPEYEITVTAGASQAIYSIISTFIRPDDEVIIFRPAFDCYEPAIELNGGKTVSVQLKAPLYGIDWQEVAQKINGRTKMIITNTPHNPSGTIWTAADVAQLQAMTQGTDIIVISDEVYEHIIFDGEQHQSACLFPDLKSRTFITASFGKTFHNTGWKIGYCCSLKALMAEFRKVHQFDVFCVHHPSQKALADYLEEPSRYLELPAFYQEKRDLFLDLIKGSRFKGIPSKGTYFQVLDYSGITDAYDLDYAKRLVKEQGIAAVPMSVFNENGLDQKVLRFCFAKTDETLKRAAEILNQI
jgi:methionine aminotransferase